MKKSAVIAYIRQLCCLGLGGQIIMPELTKVLHDLIPSRTNSFVYADEHGRIGNVFSETLFVPEEIPLLSEVSLHRESKCTTCQFRKVMHVGLPNDDSYPLLWRALNQRSLLNVPIHDPDSGILGAMQFYRYVNDTTFTHDDLHIMSRLIPYIAKGVKSNRNTRGPFVRSGDTGMIITNKSLELLHISARGLELLYLATHQVVNSCITERLKCINETPPILKELCSTLIRNSTGNKFFSDFVRQNSWGQFCFRANWLESQEVSKEKLIGITVERHIPLAICLAENIRLQNLSPRQKEVCLLLTFGCSHSAIAERLKVSQNTIGDHVKEIYLRLGVHNRDQLMDKLKTSFVG